MKLLLKWRFKGVTHLYNDNIRMNYFILSKNLMKEFLEFRDNFSEKWITNYKQEKRRLKK